MRDLDLTQGGTYVLLAFVLLGVYSIKNGFGFRKEIQLPGRLAFTAILMLAPLTGGLLTVRDAANKAEPIGPLIILDDFLIIPFIVATLIIGLLVAWSKFWHLAKHFVKNIFGCSRNDLNGRG